MRIVLSLDFTHPQFLSNCASNPALFTRCMIMWQAQWSKDSYQLLAKAELNEMMNREQNTNTPIITEDVLNIMLHIHQSCDATPLKYMEFLACYRKIFNLKLNSQGGQSSHLIAGLQKLQDAEKNVDELSQKAQNQKKELSKKQAEADQALKQIQRAMEIAAERKMEVETLQKTLQEDEMKIMKKKQQIEEELSDIQPEVDKAKLVS